MKKILFPLLGITLAVAFTGKKDLPPTITAGINAKYPNARIKGWKMVDDRYNYADWRVDNIDEVTAPDRSRCYVLYVDDSNQLDSWHNDVFKKEFLLYFDSDGKLIEREPAH